MKMKKVVSLLLAGAMVLGMTACGSSDEPADKKDGGDGKTIEILWPETDSTQVDVMENYIQPALAEAFPDITFEYTPMTNSAGDSPIKTMSASGDLPEIFFTNGSDIDAILGAGDALDLSKYLGDGWVDENYTNPDLLYNGDAIYFLTAGQNAYYSPVFYYNKAVFDENGIAEPTNMDEFVAACQKLVDAGVTPLTMAQWVSSYSLIDGIIASAAPDAFLDLNSRKCDWTDDRVKDALGYFDELKTMGAFAADIANKDDATAYSEFQSGSAAMMLTYSWFNGDMVEDKLGFEAGSFSFPNASEDYIQLIFEPRKGNGGGYTANANYDDPQLLADIMKVMVEAESERHNATGVRTNFIVDDPAEPANAFEEERYADYDRAAQQVSVLEQGQMDGVTIAEFTTLYNMLVSDDQSYLSENFIEEFQPIWEANTYGPTE
mgnify:FL=1|jgi:raffinose/stachyose/melibiose transport system substrate-binding protein